MDANLVILAGGISSRMKRAPATRLSLSDSVLKEVEKKSKSMIGVGTGSRPFLDYLLMTAERSGYREVVIVMGERDASILEYYEYAGGKERFPGLKISYVLQPIPEGRQKPLGTADALLRALQATTSWRGRKFTVCNSDNLYSSRALRVLLDDPHENAMIDYDRSALRFDHDRICSFAVIWKDVEGFLSDLVEKPSPDEIAAATDPDGRIGVSMNIFRLSYDTVYPFLESQPPHPVRDEKELSMAVAVMAKQHPKSVFTIPLAEHVPDLTSPSDIADVNRYLEQEFQTQDKTPKS